MVNSLPFRSLVLTLSLYVPFICMAVNEHRRIRQILTTFGYALSSWRNYACDSLKFI